MNEQQILAGLSGPPNVRKESQEALYGALLRLVNWPLRNQFGHSVTIPEQERLDVVGEVYAHFLNLALAGPFAIAKKSERECRQYLASALANRYLTELRKEEATVDLGAEDGSPEPTYPLGTGQVAPPLPPDETVEGRVARLSDLVDRYLATRPPRYRKHSESTWHEARRSMLGESSDSILGISSKTLPAKARDLRWAYWQRQSNFRKYLDTFIGRLEESGELTQDDAAEHRKDLLLLRRTAVSKDVPARPLASAKGSRGARK